MNPVKSDIICKIVKDWNKKKELREDYYKWISLFQENSNGPIFFGIS